jgi:hypothetical protein
VTTRADRKAQVDDEIDQFRWSWDFTLERACLKALAEVRNGLLNLKARDPGLARDCAYPLMALIAKWGWPEETAKCAGVEAGLDKDCAERWARKLFGARRIGSASGSPGKGKAASPERAT